MDDSATYDDKASSQESDSALVKSWLEQIALSKKDIKGWMKQADRASDIYMLNEKEAENEFNILYSNISTICPSVYNSQPVPDVRRRYNDGENPTAKTAAQVIERVLSFTLDDDYFDQSIKDDVLDQQLVGRGLSRLQYEPTVTQVPVPDPMTGMPSIDEMGQPVTEPVITAQRMYVQHVDWRDINHGAAKCWKDVPWLSFDHRMTKEQVTAIAPDVVEQLNFDCTVDGKMKPEDSAQSSIYKRILVHELWDKDSRKVLFIAPSFKDKPLAIRDAPFNVEGFFPCPKPLYGVHTGGLKPKVPYDYYAKQAEELNRLTGRIRALLKVLKFRGVYLTGLGTALSDIQDLDDGEFRPTDNANNLTGATGGLDKAIWIMPIEKIVTVIAQLTTQREAAKTTIYEITGIADIMRGSSNASETLGAQQLKAQWGALRLQSLQRDVQRYIRDFMRMMAEVVSENYQPDILAQISGMGELSPDVVALLRDDIARNYRVDVETDSTIKADVSRDQQNITQFTQGLAQFLPAVVPLVQQGAIPATLPIAMIKSFARTFKLGRETEDLLDALGQQASMQQQQAVQQPMAMPQQPQQVMR